MRSEGKSLRRGDVDWSQSKVVFVAPSFTTYQQAVSGFRDLPIEFWEVTKYDDGLILYERTQTKKTTASMTALRPGKVTQEVVQQVKAYTEDDLIPNEGKTREWYFELRERILKLDPQLHPHVTKTYISFRQGENWRNIFSIAFRTSKLRIELLRTKPTDVNDPEGKLTYIKDSVQNWNQHVSYFEITDEKELDYAVYVLQQAVENFRAIQEK